MRSLSRTLTLGLLFVLGFGSACQNVTPPGVYFDTEPRGAELRVDGRRSGYVTPCLVALDEDDRYRVELSLAGYETRSLVLHPQERRTRITADDTGIAYTGFRFIIGLEAGDLFMPFLDNEAHAPSRIFLRLKPVSRLN